MSELPRKTIAELLARYENEPELRDLYTEGAFDRELLAHVLRKHGVKAVAIYDIDTVDLSPAELATLGLTDGRKQRILALARLLAHLDDSCLFRCIADRDLDHWFGPLEDTRRLRWTHFSAIECYFLAESVVHEILVTAAKVKVSDYARLWASLVETLRILYSLRLADRELALQLDWISFDRCVSRSGDEVQFDEADFVKRLLMKSGRMRDASAFSASAKAWKARLVADPRLEVRGHDVVDLLAWIVAAFKGVASFSRPDAIERLLIVLSPQLPELLALTES